MVSKLGLYGAPDMVRIHGEARMKYPTEYEAALHIYDPDAARFVPAPVGPLKVWCTGCRILKEMSEFHRHAARPNGYQPYCIKCQKARRKMGKHLKQVDPGRWYRN